MKNKRTNNIVFNVYTEYKKLEKRMGLPYGIEVSNKLRKKLEKIKKKDNSIYNIIIKNQIFFQTLIHSE
ncbi:MAG: hypothetical protein HF967_10530 [Methanosarcinales archaeon]|nr:hypothetical protein [Methanosarcinales archaeon]